jgi:hypothetical protein
MNTFAIIARTGKRVHADECQDKSVHKYGKGFFTCIDCGKHVHVRRGNKRAWHFSHYCERDSGECPHKNGGETKQHYDAKHLIAKNIDKCAFAIEKCPTCKCTKFYVGQEMGGVMHIHKCHAEVEKKIPGTKRIADVAAISQATGRVVAAIEILHTHEVEPAKRLECNKQGVMVLEVTSSDVLNLCQKFETAELKHCSTTITLIQVPTVNMKHTSCCKCTMVGEFMYQTQLQVSYEEWYNQAWQKHWIHKMEKAALLLQRKRVEEDKLMGKEIAEVLAQDQWYKQQWTMYGELLSAKTNDEKEEKQRKNLLKRGFESANARLQGEGTHVSKKRRNTKDEKCVGKCKLCNSWMFESEVLCDLESDTTSKKAWDTLFANDPIQYRKRYRTGWQNDTSSIAVHETCTIECPCCERKTFVQQLARYGMCMQCNIYYRNLGRNFHENKLRALWCRKGLLWD